MPVPNSAPVAAFAYLRHLPGMDKEAVDRTLKELTAFAEQQGLVLAGVFYEKQVGDRLPVWCELVAACRTERVTNVVVPSTEHFHGTTDLAAFMREELAATVQGTVWLAGEADVTVSSETAVHDGS